MDQIIDMREDAVRGVAIRPQKRRFPFEIFNTLLTIICLATAALVVYKLFQHPTGGQQRMGSFMFVIHAEADGISEKKVKLRSKDSAWVKNNAIVVPCDGLYLIYAHVSSNRTPLMEIKKKEDSDSDSDTDSWLLPKTKEYSPLITSMLRVNNTIRMLLDLSNDELKDDNSYLGIALLQIHQDIHSCQQIIQKSCKYEKHRDGLCLSTPISGKYIGQ